MGATLGLAPALAADETYTVKRGDTLCGIAQCYGITPAALAERNGLSRNAYVYTGQRLLIPTKSAARKSSSAAAEETYTVKRGDTLSGIAKDYGITPATLAERNGLSGNAYVYSGQRLLIPAQSSARQSSSSVAARASGNARVALPRSIQRAIDRAPVRVGRWQFIVLHHSHVDQGTVKGMDKYHREVRHMENGLAYHFVIGNGRGMGDGEIAVGNRWTRQLDGGHLASLAQNKVAIGICLVGDFDKHPPSRSQMESLRALVEALMARCRLTPHAIRTHQQINVVYTRCPGAKFPLKSFVSSLQSSSR